MRNTILIGLVVVVVAAAAAAGGFFYGTSVGEARANQTRQRFFQERSGGQGGQFQGPGGTPQPGQGGATRFGGGTVGTIKAVEGGALTITTQEGTVRVQTTDTTIIEKYTAVGVGDLGVGERVVISGSRNEDGSVTARSIQVLPASGFEQPSQP